MLSENGYGLLTISEVASDDLLKEFDCGVESLNSFLRASARESHTRRLAATSIILHRDVGGVVGYFTLSSDALRLNESERFDLDISQDFEIDYIPAVTIGRLGVARALQGQGVGDQALKFIRGEAQKAPARLLVVDAIDAVVGFYAKMGFQEALFAKSRKRGTNSPTTKMWLDLIV